MSPTSGVPASHSISGPDGEETTRQLRLAEICFSYSLGGIAILDREFNFVRVNEAYARASRRHVSELAGRNHFELYPSDAKSIFEDVVKTKQPYATTTRPFMFIDQPERGVTYWDWTLVPVLNGKNDVEYLVLSLVEVTERVRAEEALRIAALVYQHSSEAMLVTDPDNRIVATNDAFAALTGYGAKELIGHGLDILKSDHEPADVFAKMMAALQSSGHWRGEIWSRRKNGEPMALRLTVKSVCDDAGKTVQRVALFSDITETKQAEALIWEHANFDPLTRLPNRHMFHSRLSDHIEMAEHKGDSFALLLIDLDQFKDVNDTLGHDKGDALLIEAARRLRGCIPAGATLARLGGDEFALILADRPNHDAVNDSAGKINALLAQPFRLGLETVFVSASIGITFFPEDGSDMDELLRHADQAMYAAKHAGRNRYCRFTSALQEAAQVRRHLMSDLRSALPNKQFELYYQPIIDLKTGAIRKAEALIRWRHPARGMVSPTDFIPLAEATGMILEIGEWVFKEAAAQMQRLHVMGHSELKIGINISPVQFHNDRDLYRKWVAHLEELGLPAQCMVIEITEGLLLNLTQEVKDKLLAFRDAGTQVALDDFGTGYSSLAYLQKLDIDYIKIDRAFVNNLGAGANDCALCEAMIVMAHKLGLAVVAEGVETEVQRDLLAAAGCDFGQGYFFSRPVPASEFEAMLLQ
ncbi:hypothetical protein GCM10027343_30790 [Noviherbaspirillum agri]